MSSSKKKICFFTTVDWFILTHRKKLLRELIKSYDVTVIVFENTKKLEISFPKLEILSLNISRSNVSFFKNILSLFKLFKISNKKKFDLFYVVGVRSIFFTLLLEIFLKSSFLYTFSGLGTLFTSKGFILSTYKTLLKILVYFSKSNIIVQNQEDLNLIKSYSKPEKKITCILGSGVDLETFKPSHVKKLKKIIFVGRLLKSKGILEYIELAKRSKKYGLEFNIYGSIDDNLESIKQRDLKNLPKQVIFHGNSSKISDEMSDASIIILPSKREGLSLTLCEAAASGLVLITYDVPGCREVCINNYNGFLCEFENIDALQKSVIKVISDEKNFKKMSANSRKLAIKNFDINIINKKIIQEIEVFF